ncbi:MAG TPA: ABC transporter permease [Gammaproteobacteria bacterium]
MGTLQLVGRRLLATIPVLLGVTLLTFFALDLLPGTAASQLLGAEATAEQIARLEARLGLERPAWERYRRWLGGVLAGDLGRSLASGRPVGAMVAERLPATLELVGIAFALSLGVAVPTALAAARRPEGPTDRLCMAASMLALSVPPYVLALLLVLAFAVGLGVLPAVGFTPAGEGLAAHVRSVVLPAAAIALPLAAFYSRFLRGDLLEQLQGQDYVLTAVSKGLGPWRVLLRHALPNSLLGLLTVVGLNLGALISGTVIVEQIFGIPGVGQLLLQAINLRDAVVVQAIVLVLAATTVLANLAVDLLYAVLDPRIRYGGA